MKKHPRRNFPAALPVTALLTAALLALSFAVPPLSAQTRTEEWVETGRFGAEEPDDPNAGAPEKGLNTEWLYAGFRTGPSLRLYTPSNDVRYTGGETLSVSLDIALQANVQVLSFLSVQAEAVFTWDNASLWAYRGTPPPTVRYTKDYRVFSLQIPLLVKYDFYPGRFRLSPFLGAYCLLPLGELEASNSLDSGRSSLTSEFSPPLGFLGGLGGALKFGPGMIIADLRYLIDLGEVKAPGIEKFRRSAISVTVGYEFGFFPKKKGGRP